MEETNLESLKTLLTKVSNTQNDMEYMLREMEKTLTQLNQTVVGNPTYGQKGLISEIDDIKKYVDNDKMIKNKILGGLTVIGIVWTLVYNYFLQVIKGQHG
jgi:aminopeptidase-like protein